MCSSLTHYCKVWAVNRTVIRSINGFNSRCLHIMAGEDYPVTATAPAFDLVLAVRRRRLWYLVQPAEWLRRRHFATTCDNGVEPFNVARQSGVAIVNLRFLSDFLVMPMHHSTLKNESSRLGLWPFGVNDIEAWRVAKTADFEWLHRSGIPLKLRWPNFALRIWCVAFLF